MQYCSIAELAPLLDEDKQHVVLFLLIEAGVLVSESHHSIFFIPIFKFNTQSTP